MRRQLHELHLVGVRERLVGVIQVSAPCRGPVCTENLRPDVVVMKSAKDRV